MSLVKAFFHLYGSLLFWLFFWAWDTVFLIASIVNESAWWKVGLWSFFHVVSALGLVGSVFQLKKSKQTMRNVLQEAASEKKG